MYYLSADNTECSCELAILDGNNLCYASLVDVPSRNRKISASLVLEKSVIFGSYDGIHNYISTWNAKYRYKTAKSGKKLHTIIKNVEEKNVFVNWDNADVLDGLAYFIQNNLSTPVTRGVLEAMYPDGFKSSNAIKRVRVYTINPRFEGLEAFKVDTDSLINQLNKVDIGLKESEFDWESIKTTDQYLLKFAKPISEKLRKSIEVLYDPDSIHPDLFKGVQPKKGQIPAFQAGIEVLKKHDSVYLAWEMSFGKTYGAIKINDCSLKGNYVTLAQVPAVTLTQWEEAIEQCDLDCYIHIIKKTSEFIKLYEDTKLEFDKPCYILVGKETFKLDAPKKHGVNFKTRTLKFEKVSQYGTSFTKKEVTAAFCPDCGQAVVNQYRKSTEYFDEKDFEKPKKSNYRCQCSAILWQSSFKKTKKSSLIKYIRAKRIMFDSFLVDEAHQSATSSSIIGTATRNMFKHAKKSILLSGTPSQGYSSGYHNILMGTSSRKLAEDGCLLQPDFIKKYGTLIATDTIKDADRKTSGSAEIKENRFREKEGINVLLMSNYLSGNVVYAQLTDLGEDLPNLTEEFVAVDPDSQLRRDCRQLMDNIKRANRFNYYMYYNTIVRHYLTNPASWSGIPIADSVVRPRNNRNFTKLLKVANDTKAEVDLGRKVCIYTDFSQNDNSLYNDGKSVSVRLKEFLSDMEVDAYILKSGDAIGRKNKIVKALKTCDVIIANPALMAVGLNLIELSSFFCVIPSFRLNIVSQAVRRGYRINQSQDVKIKHYYYEGTFDEEVMDRYILKDKEAKAITGVFDEVDWHENRTASLLSSNVHTALTSG